MSDMHVLKIEGDGNGFYDKKTLALILSGLFAIFSFYEKQNIYGMAFLLLFVVIWL